MPGSKDLNLDISYRRGSQPGIFIPQWRSVITIRRQKYFSTRYSPPWLPLAWRLI